MLRKNFNMGGSTASEASRLSACVGGVHRVQGQGAGFARGKYPLPERKIVFCVPNMHNFRPFFGLNFRNIMISGGRKGQSFFS